MDFSKELGLGNTVFTDMTLDNTLSELRNYVGRHAGMPRDLAHPEAHHGPFEAHSTLGSTEVNAKAKKPPAAKFGRVTAFEITGDLFEDRDELLVPREKTNKETYEAESKAIIYNLFRYAHGGRS